MKKNVITNTIERYLIENDMSMRGFVRHSGLSYGTVRRLGTNKLSIQTLSKLAKALNLNYEEIMILNAEYNKECHFE